MCACEGLRNVRFLGNLACFVFLKHPFWDSPFCLISHVFLSECLKNAFVWILVYLKLQVVCPKVFFMLFISLHFSYTWQMFALKKFTCFTFKNHYLFYFFVRAKVFIWRRILINDQMGFFQARNQSNCLKWWLPVIFFVKITMSNIKVNRSLSSQYILFYGLQKCI